MHGLDNARTTLDGIAVTEALGMLAGVMEDVVAEPENLEGALQKMIEGLQGLLGLGGISLSASFGEGHGVSASSGVTDGAASEIPIRPGKVRVGAILVHLDTGDDGQREVLRAAAGVAGLALAAAHAREIAAQKTAQGSVVQIASEALGAIKEEKDLYRTVLVLTLELLDASAGAILLGDGDDVVSMGFEGSEETLGALRGVRFVGRGAWTGLIDGYHLLGVGLEDGGAVFLARPARPYTRAEGVSLKLVGRQLARARE